MFIDNLYQTLNFLFNRFTNTSTRIVVSRPCIFPFPKMSSTIYNDQWTWPFTPLIPHISLVVLIMMKLNGLYPVLAIIMLQVLWILIQFLCYKFPGIKLFGFLSPFLGTMEKGHCKQDHPCQIFEPTNSLEIFDQTNSYASLFRKKKHLKII